MSSLTTLQIVVFAFLIGAEATVSYIYSLDLYEKKDTRTSLIIGAISAIVVLSTTGLYLSLLISMQRYSLFDIRPGVASWIALFLICDLSYYLLHLLSHKVRFLWASHMLHHSSQRLNYTTVFRGPVVYLSFRMIFWTPMVLIGFSPAMILVTDTLIQLYTVFTHTTTIGKLGVLERVLNTPAHHRLHHSCNPEYLDRNYGGVLIVWDRLFGTFVSEQSPPVFGMVETRGVDSPVRLLLMEWRAMAKDISIAESWRQKIRAIFGKPGGGISSK